MANHFVIISDINNTHNDFANLDVTSDPASAVTVTVFLPAGAKQQVLAMNANNFATTNDLFTVSGGGTVLVGSGTANAALASKAALRQKKLVMSVPPEAQSLGTSFGFPLNDVGTGAFLLIGNPNGAQADGAVTYGDPAGGAPVAAAVAVPGLGVQTIAIPAGSATTRVNLTITNGLKVLLQVLINGKGQEFSMTIASPTN